MGCAAVVAACAIVCWAELVIQYIQIGILQFPPVVVGLFLFLSLGNAGLKRVLGEFALAVIWTAINFFARVGSPFFPWP